MIRIDAVKSPSPASRAGLRPSDILHSCNEECIDDWIDFAYHATGAYLKIEYSRGGWCRTVLLNRRPGVEWGLSLAGQSPRTCRRRCVFCFVDQLPSGVRRTLAVKDDDIRYSFYQGTYVTLDDEELDICIGRGLSPIHVSVHTTDADLRGRLLGTGRPEPICEPLRRLSDASIQIETQIVVVPGWNDGDELSSTMEDLLEIPGVSSIGVVPVGLTSHRDGLVLLRRPGPDECMDILDRCERIRTRAIHTRGTAFCYPSDELFLIAGRKLPDPSFYEECTLHANGIGLLSDLLSFDPSGLQGKGTICTGVLAAPFLRRILHGTSYRVIEVENRFFGSEVGVSGLLSGADIVHSIQMTDVKPGGGPIILPGVMFSHEGLTLDDMTLVELSDLLGRPVVIAESLKELD